MAPVKRRGDGSQAARQKLWYVDVSGNGTGPWIPCVHLVTETGESYLIEGGGGGSPSGGLTDSQLRAAPVPVSGFPASISVSNLPETQPVSGTFWPQTQPVSGPLTDAQLRAAPVSVSGLLTDAQLRASPLPVSGAFYPATQPVSGPLTDAQLRAGPVPVSGTFWQAVQPVSGPLTDAQLRAQAVPVALGADIQHKPASTAVTATGAAGAAVTLTLPAPGAGLFHYIVALELSLYSNAARTGAAGVQAVTSTNLHGMAWDFDKAGAIGTISRKDTAFAVPLKSQVANTATTIVGSAPTGGIWRLSAIYYTGP